MQEKTYQLLSGHFHHEGIEYKPGDRIRTKVPLTELFPNKFVVSHTDDVPSADRKPAKTANEKESPSTDEKPQETAEEKQSAAEVDLTDAKDVTTDFPQAMENGWTVMKLKKGYVVLESMAGSALSDLLSSKAKVNEFLESA